jgi:hypothetical protein
MKIKSIVFTAVLATAILCSMGFVNAQTKAQSFITIISPNGGESFSVDDSLPISLSSANLPIGTPYEMDLVGTDLNGTAHDTWLGGREIAAGNKQAFSITIPDSVLPGNFYRLKISCDNPNSCSQSQSAANFTILPSTKSITVISPNGGENIRLGQKFSIKWNSSGLSGPVNIYLQDNSINCGTPPPAGCWNSFGISSASNTGNYLWDTNKRMFGDAGPSSVTVNIGSKYKIEICGGSGGGICGYSKNYFTISNSVTQTTVGTQSKVINNGLFLKLINWLKNLFR